VRQTIEAWRGSLFKAERQRRSTKRAMFGVNRGSMLARDLWRVVGAAMMKRQACRAGQ
jgi:hypothetical protein